MLPAAGGGTESTMMRNREYDDEGHREDNIKAGLLPARNILSFEEEKIISPISGYILAHFKANLCLTWSVPLRTEEISSSRS